MVSEKDYLQDFRIMDEQTKTEWIKSVDKWTDETFPQLMAAADSWEKTPVKDFDEGCKLASAFVNARPLISVIYQYDSKKAVQKINAFLAEVRKRSGLATKSFREANDKTHYRAIVPELGIPDEDGNLQIKEYVEPEVDNRRPQHLSEYINLLPEELQKTLPGKMKEMYLALAEYRGRLEVLVEHPNASQEQCAEMARKCVMQEQEIRNAWDEVDEYVKAAQQNGGKAVNYIPKQTDADVKAATGMKRPGDFTYAEIESMADLTQKKLCRRSRITGDKKYIMRVDVKMTDAYKEQLALRIQELLDWEVDLPEKTAEAVKRAGLSIPGVYVPEEDDECTETSKNEEG